MAQPVTSPQAMDTPESSAMPPMTRYGRALVVANPVAGRGKGVKVAQELVEGLRRLGAKTELHLTKGRGDARAWLRSLDHDVDLVVAVGGDGTVREVLDGLVDPEIPIAVLPLGTANVMAAELALPRDVDRALEIISAGATAAIDVASVNGHLSFLVTGVGIDGSTVREVEARRRGPITKWSYLPALLRALRVYRSPDLSVEIDGKSIKEPCSLVLVSNISHYGGFLRLDPKCRLDDGQFEVYLFRGKSIGRLAWHALRGFVGKLPGGKCEMRRARHVRIHSDPPTPYQVDGDFRGETPVEISVSDRQYHLVVPHPNKDV